jgi:hypothetical protein
VKRSATVARKLLLTLFQSNTSLLMVQLEALLASADAWLASRQRKSSQPASPMQAFFSIFPRRCLQL